LFKYLHSKFSEHGRRKLANFLFVEFGLFIIIWLLHSYPVINLAIDHHMERCLQNVRVAALIHIKPLVQDIKQGDLVFWKPFAALAYVRDEYVVKRVAGVQGDKLLIKGDSISINGQVVANGFSGANLADLGNVKSSLDKSEIIPKNQFFVIGDNPLSYDSRYWGYLPYSDILGTALALF